MAPAVQITDNEAENAFIALIDKRVVFEMSEELPVVALVCSAGAKLAGADVCIIIKRLFKKKLYHFY